MLPFFRIIVVVLKLVAWGSGLAAIVKVGGDDHFSRGVVHGDVDELPCSLEPCEQASCSAGEGMDGITSITLGSLFCFCKMRRT